MRRLRLWAFLVSSVVVALSIQALMPEWHLLPGSLGHVSAAALLGVVALLKLMF